MNKRKKNEEPSGRFRNKPFDSLKTLKQKSAPTKQAPDSAHSSSADDVDDEELFLRAVQGTKTVGASTVRSTKGETPPPPISGVEEGQAFLKAMKSMGTRFKDENPRREDEDRKQQSSAGRMRQLKRGTIRISEELDLHGHRKEEALRRLALFIAGAYRRGRQAVLVITGKGTNSPEGPVLPDAVSQWLAREGNNMVAEFAQAPQKLGGRGAFIVFLRNRGNDDV